MRKYIKKCVHCGEEFTYESSRALYCSKKCKRKVFYERHKEKENRDSRLYKQRNREKINEYKYNYRWDNIERERAKEREYTEKHRKRINAGMVKRRKESHIRRINHRMSAGVLHSLNFKGISKNGRHWEDLVGWTKEQLKSHLERLFKDGMSWDNFGEWHIDHVIPKVFFKFDNTDDVEFRMCWRLENLRPLWKTDNRSKQAKIVLWGKEINIRD